MSRSSHDGYDDSLPKKKKRKNLFDLLYSREGKEITEDDRKAPRNFSFFFKLAGRNLSRIFYINIIFLIANFPLIIMLLFPAKIFHLHALSPTSPIFLPTALMSSVRLLRRFLLCGDFSEIPQLSIFRPLSHGQRL